MEQRRESDGADAVLTVDEAAARIRVHRNSIYRWIQRGILPASKERGKWMVAADDLYRLHTQSSSRHPQLDSLQQARQSVASVRRLLHATPLPMGVTDADGYFLGVNDAYRDVLGYPRSWFYTHTYLDYTETDARESNEHDRLRAIQRPGLTVSYRKPAVSSSGKIVLIDFRIVAASLDDDPQSAQVICLATNIDHQ